MQLEQTGTEPLLWALRRKPPGKVLEPGPNPPACSELSSPLRKLGGNTEITGDLYLDTVVHADVTEVLEALTALSGLSMALSSLSLEGKDGPRGCWGQGGCQACSASACFLLLQAPSWGCSCTLCPSSSPTEPSARSFRTRSLQSTTISPGTLVKR